MQDALLEYLDIMEKEDLREVLKEIKIPLQFINGREDEICGKETVAFIQELSPGSRFDFFEQCGHFPFLSKSYEFNKIIEEFLEESTL
jgi:pimeloyl-[acyl-carrier protein] methyl ester esterase